MAILLKFGAIDAIGGADRLRPLIHSFVKQLFSLYAPRRNPEHARRGEGIDGPSLPPGDFVSDAVEVAVMNSAQRYGEFVTDLAPHRTGLGELEMVGVGRASAANQTRV